MTTKNSSESYCFALMKDVAEAIIGGSKRTVGYLREEPKNPRDRDMGKHISNALRKANLSGEQLDELEKAFIQEQQLLVGWIFSVLDQGIPEPGLPKKVSLVNMDTNEEVSPGSLNDVFTKVFFEIAKKNNLQLF